MNIQNKTGNEPNNDRIALIRKRLTDAFSPISLNIEDDSIHHRNHPGAAAGAGHYKVFIVSNSFNNISTVERHRMVYKALDGLIGPEIHAIQIFAKTLEEKEKSTC